MKSILLIIVSFFFCYSINGQSKVYKIPFNKGYNKPFPGQNGIIRDTIIVNPITEDQKRLMDEIRSKTGVIALPLDNMPCPVTTIDSNMPVLKNLLGTNLIRPVPIPNAYGEWGPKVFKQTIPLSNGIIK